MQAYRNYTIRECDATLAVHKEAIFAGTMTFWQKFTCEKCWRRIQVDEPNKLFISGHCQHCGHVTNLVESGCNYALMIGRSAGNNLNQPDGEHR